MSKKWVSSALFCLLIFTWPFNLFIKWVTADAYSHGLLIDYLIPKIFASDLVILLILFAGYQDWFSILKQAWRSFGNRILLIGWIALCFRQLFSTLPILGTLTALKYSCFMLLLFTCYRWHKQGLLEKSWIVFSLCITVLSQFLIGSSQFTLQKSVFPSYSWLGETRLESYNGISRGVFQGVEKILAYGTTSHPNIWAGILIVSVWLILLFVQRSKNSLRSIYAIFVAPIIFLSLSLSALAATTLGTIFFDAKKYSQLALILSLILFLGSPFFLLGVQKFRPENTSISRRVWLNQQSAAIIFKNPIWGTGFSQFTKQLETRTLSESIQFAQPVHHIGLLWVSEAGLLGSLLILGVGWQTKKYWKKFSCLLVMLVPIASFDHYLLTNQLGILLVIISGTIYLLSTQVSTKDSTVN